MTTQSFLIGPIKDAVRGDLKPFATPTDSFVNMTNAFLYRSRVRRRLGYNLLGRLSQQIAAQSLGSASATFSNNMFSTLGISLSGANVVPGTLLISVNSGSYILQDTGLPGQIVQTGGAGVAFLNGNINYLTSVLTLNFSSNPGGTVVVSFGYAINQPVMGLKVRDLFSINAQDLIAFDQIYSYRYSNTLDQFTLLPSIMATTWNGSNSDFFFTTNYAQSFWATNNIPGLNGYPVSAITTGATTTVTTTVPNNYAMGQSVTFVNLGGSTNLNGMTGIIASITNPSTFVVALVSSGTYTAGGIVLNSTVQTPGQDGIRYYTGTTWVNYNPPLSTTTALAGALMIFPYRGYLVFLAPWVGNETGVTQFGNQALWTQLGTPYYSAPVPVNQTIDIFAARNDIIGRGGTEDGSTNEIIIAAGFIRDQLVVFFQNSTWALKFTNNTVSPFAWYRVNIEFGSQSTFSAVPFDKGLMAVGPRGIVVSDGNDTKRFDEKIPEDVFKLRNTNNGPKRVQGLRTFETQLVYWTFPDDDNPSGIYPDQVLVFNYQMGTWSFYDDTFTTFGSFRLFADTTWADLVNPWYTYGDRTWNSAKNNDLSEGFVAGTQHGFVEIIEQGIQNDASLNITAITLANPGVFTAIDHNLPVGAWIKLIGIAGTVEDDTPIGGTSVTLNGRNFKIASVPSKDTFTLEEFQPINVGTAPASSSTFSYTLQQPYIPIYPDSVYIQAGGIIFTDPNQDGTLIGDDGLSTGTINYITGNFVLNFNTPLGSDSAVIVRVTANQDFSPVATSGTYTGGGYIVKISNIDVSTKYFNFFNQDQRARISRIDFYVQSTTFGEFTCNVYGDSNTSIPINPPLSDNTRSNVVLTDENVTEIQDPQQIIFRLFCNAIAQTLQLQFTLSDQQMSVNSINGSDIDISAFIVAARAAGRLG